MTMDETRTRRPLRAGPVRRVRTRFVLLAVLGLVAAGIGAGLALAKTSREPIGTGVVVVRTALGYENGNAQGTGIVLTSSGEVLTNNHVIRGATTIKIVVPGTGRSYTAKVVGYNVSADVAVLQATGASNLKSVSLGNSSTVRVGQAVTATGNAGGRGTLTSSSGRVTALARSITVSDESGGSQRLTGLIEANSALEPGDSGGPLLNSAGKVIGMNTAASAGDVFRSTASGGGYAIPINRAVAIARQIETGKASATVHVGPTAFLGISVSSNDSTGSGVVIEAVVPGGAASAAGLEPGDVITSIDGRAVSSSAAVRSVILLEKPRARVPVTYFDTTGASGSTTVTLTSGPPQ